MLPVCIDAGCPKRMSSTHYQYVFIRGDLPVGVQLAQVGHAASEAPGPKPVPGFVIRVLECRDETHLQRVRDLLTERGIPHGEVVECQDDPEYPGQLMAIGVAPTTDPAPIRRLTSSLPSAGKRWVRASSRTHVALMKCTEVTE